MDAMLYGVGVGLALGLTGAGGGILAIPALVIGLHFSPSQAIPISLLAIALSAFIGSIDGFRQGLVRYKAAFLMGSLGIALAPVGIWLSSILPVPLLMLMFSAVMLFISSRVLVQMRFQSADAHSQQAMKRCTVNRLTGRFNWNYRCFRSLSILGGLSGLFSGMLGVGGGFLIVPGVRYLSDLEMHGTIATSLAVISIITGVTASMGLISGVYQPINEWGFVVACVVGMLAGRVLAPHIPARILTLIFACFAFAIALLLIFRTIFSTLI
ncbi:MAG: sulfite exporter TauE/SafE family protein [Pseudomonadota bacterium]|uniref:sulfite exporter TauE/SafE family protein n=1 Tax=Methylophaga aminisulfidivorans TaxID=230105 RepID=UPI0024E25E3E|nr:sulfite exporter TauE/SafE family protein [Methylophaga aminisulfidivorans]MEC9411970.1 sulfite exporter TauE/SafE family protein [Pseudomonadota bacterium]